MRTVLEQHSAQIIWAGTLMVVAMALLSFATYYKKGTNPVFFGLTACALSFVTPLVWWPLTITWWSVLVPVVTIGLFLFGLFRPDGRDDPWYYAAVVTALTGKMIVVYVAKLIHLLGEDVKLPVWALLLIIVAGFGLLVVLINVIGDSIDSRRRKRQRISTA